MRARQLDRNDEDFGHEVAFPHVVEDSLPHTTESQFEDAHGGHVDPERHVGSAKVDAVHLAVMDIGLEQAPLSIEDHRHVR